MIVVWILLALAVFWLWFFIGSTTHCPQCGRDLRINIGGPLSVRQKSCTCGWSQR